MSKERFGGGDGLVEVVVEVVVVFVACAVILGLEVVRAILELVFFFPSGFK